MGFVAVGGQALGARIVRVMPMLEPVLTHCPYCGEPIEVLVDSSVESQHYVEDCQVCCRPMQISVEIDEDGALHVRAAAENEG